MECAGSSAKLIVGPRDLRLPSDVVLYVRYEYSLEGSLNMYGRVTYRVRRPIRDMDDVHEVEATTLQENFSDGGTVILTWWSTLSLTQSEIDALNG